MEVPTSHFNTLQLRNVSYFSFFSELYRSDHIATTVETLALVTVFLISVVANVGTGFLVTRERRSLVNKTVLTLNLFVADLLFVSMTPLIVVVRWAVSWRLGNAACRAMLYVISMSGCVTITTLACISVERVMAILRLHPAPTLNPRMVCATLGCIWAFSALTSMPLSLFFTVREVESFDERNIQICTLMWPDMLAEIVWDVAFTALCFLVPGLVIVFSYSKILQLSKRSRRRLHPCESPSRLNRVHHYVSRQDIKIFRTLFVLMLSFFIMWSPIFIITFLILMRNFQSLYVTSTMFFWVVTFTLANSALNPILYSLCQFRHGWRRLCCVSMVTPMKRASKANGHRQERGPTPHKVYTI
ncbi:free fatty acid receptor 4-like [Osmerus eperlanus]|uniref:free fatty acid receptor 4-like n=1 Tax=Osmerus eperlanus TaxID=29151 RepID=UPI002E1003CE